MTQKIKLLDGSYESISDEAYNILTTPYVILNAFQKNALSILQSEARNDNISYTYYHNLHAYEILAPRMSGKSTLIEYIDNKYSCIVVGKNYSSTISRFGTNAHTLYSFNDKIIYKDVNLNYILFDECTIKEVNKDMIYYYLQRYRNVKLLLLNTPI